MNKENEKKNGKEKEKGKKKEKKKENGRVTCKRVFIAEGGWDKQNKYEKFKTVP
jgi:hypothetical protein